MAENINLTLENLRAAIEWLAADLGQCCTSKGQDIESPPSDGAIDVGPDEQFPDQESYFVAKCNAANAIYDQVLGTTQWLETNNLDLLAGVLGGMTTSLALGLLISGPVGWAVTVAAVTVTSITTYLISQAIDFEDLEDALVDVHNELVLSLFNASNTFAARNSFISALAASTEPTTSVERDLARLMLSSDLLNLLFDPRQDVGVYQSPDPVDCGDFLLAVWSFIASGEGWVFTDESDGTQSAAGVWVGAREAWEIELTIVAGNGDFAKGTIKEDGLSIAVTPGSSVQLDYSATSDGFNSSQTIKVTYSDMTTDSVSGGGHSSEAGTLILSIAVTKTIEQIECSAAREDGNYNYTIDLEEVRVVGT